MRSINILLVTLGMMLFSLSSCFKKEDPILLPRSTASVTTLAMGSDYSNQIFFDLSTNNYKLNDIKDWDICFDAKPEGFAIYINNGTGVLAKKTDLYSPIDIREKDTVGISLYDEQTGDVSKSAFGDWRTYKINSGGVDIYGIYVLDLGKSLPFKDRYKKIRVSGVDDTAYLVSYCSLDESTFDIKYIAKSKTENFTYFSFKGTGNIVPGVEPEKNTWDVEFTKYKHVFYDIGPNPFPYNVTGVLINPNKVEVAVDSTLKFSDINWNMCQSMRFSNRRDIIGYNWKSIDMTSYTYTVNSKVTYIIKDTDGQVYKLRFLDFYNANREKGNPKFEFERIK